MKTIFMSDVPDDLTTVGRHQGNAPPTETGQEVRSPDGPEPDTTPATPSRALFQLVRTPDNDRVQIRVHSPRADVPPPDDETEEIGQYRRIDALRAALEAASIDGQTAVFDDAETGKLLTDSDVSSDHAWIGKPRYEVITFFSDDDAATAYAQNPDQSADGA
jgi:hypothetical protein